VGPAWRDLPIFRIPKRLRDKAPGARGSDDTFCFRAGNGPFASGSFAAGLELVVDGPTHACIAPAQSVPLDRYESDLAATRTGWQVDES
jgi:hypothetical protein